MADPIDDIIKKLIDENGIDSVINTPIDPDSMDIDEIFARERIQGQNWLEKNTIPEDQAPTKKANLGLSDAEVEKLQAEYDEIRPKMKAYLDELHTVEGLSDMSEEERIKVMQDLKVKHGVDKAPPTPPPSSSAPPTPSPSTGTPSPQSGAPAGDVVIKDGNGNIVHQNGVDVNTAPEKQVDNSVNRNTKPVGRRVDPNPQPAGGRPTIGVNSQPATQTPSGGAQAKVVSNTTAAQNATTNAAQNATQGAARNSTGGVRAPRGVLDDLSEMVSKGPMGSKNLRVAAAAAAIGGAALLLSGGKSRAQASDEMQRKRLEMQRRGVIS